MSDRCALATKEKRVSAAAEKSTIPERWTSVTTLKDLTREGGES